MRQISSAWELRDVSLATLFDGAEIIKAGAIRFGIRFKPLLSGEFKLGSAAIADARIVPAAFGAEGPRDWTSSLVDERGLIDPDKVSALIFQSAHRAFRAFEARATAEHFLRECRDRPCRRRLSLEHSHHFGDLTQVGDTLTLDGLVAFDGRRMTVEGAAERDASGRIASLDLRFSGADLNFAFGEAASGAEVHGGIRIGLTGAESVGGSPDMLAVDLNIDEAEIGGDPLGRSRGPQACAAFWSKVPGRSKSSARSSPADGRVSISTGRLARRRRRLTSARRRIIGSNCAATNPCSLPRDRRNRPDLRRPYRGHL